MRSSGTGTSPMAGWVGDGRVVSVVILHTKSRRRRRCRRRRQQLPADPSPRGNARRSAPGAEPPGRRTRGRIRRRVESPPCRMPARHRKRPLTRSPRGARRRNTVRTMLAYRVAARVAAPPAADAVVARRRSAPLVGTSRRSRATAPYKRDRASRPAVSVAGPCRRRRP